MPTITFKPPGYTPPRDPTSPNPNWGPPGIGGFPPPIPPPHVYPWDFPFPPNAPGPADVNKTSQTQGKREQTFTAADGPAPVVYGTSQVGGKVIDVRTRYGDLYVAMIVCAGEIENISSYTLNRKDPLLITHSYEFHTGGVDGEASTLMNAVYTADLGYVPLYPGFAYAVFKFPAEANAMADPTVETGFEGIPEFRFIVNGKKVVDPRSNFILRSTYFAVAGTPTADTWSLYAGTAPTVTNSQATMWGETSAGKWDCTGGAATIRYFSSSSRTTGESPYARGFGCLMKANAAVTIDVTVDSKGTVTDALTETPQSASVTTEWKWFDFPSTADGSNLVVDIDIPSGTILYIDRPHLYVTCATWASGSPGYVLTSGSVREGTDTTGTIYSENPAYCIADAMTDKLNGAGIPSSMLNWGAFGIAAAICETQVGGNDRFRINGTFGQQTSVMDVLDSLRLACCGEIYVNEGLYCLFVDAEQEAPVATFDEATNARDTEVSREGTRNKPTVVTVKFPNSNVDWVTDSVESKSTGVDTGTEEVRESLYEVAVVSTATYANRIASFVRKQADADLRARFIASPSATRLKRGDLIEITSQTGLAAKRMLVTSVSELPNHEYDVSAREYDADVYDDGSYSGDSGTTIISGDDEMGYLDPWLGCYGHTYPYNGSAPANRTVTASEDWILDQDNGGDTSFGGVNYRRFRTLTINGSVVISIKSSPFFIFADTISFGNTGSIISANGQDGGASVTFAGEQAFGGLASATDRAQGGCGGGILVVVCNTITGALGKIRANGGNGYASSVTGGSDAGQPGQGAFSVYRPSGSPGPTSILASAERWVGGRDSTSNLLMPPPPMWIMHLGYGGSAASPASDATRAYGGGSGLKDGTDAFKCGGGSGIGGGAGYTEAGGAPRSTPSIWQILELARLGCLGGGGGAAGVDGGNATAGGGGGGGAVLVFCKTNSAGLTYTEVTATGGTAQNNGSGAASTGADGVASILVW